MGTFLFGELLGLVIRRSFEIAGRGYLVRFWIHGVASPSRLYRRLPQNDFCRLTVTAKVKHASCRLRSSFNRENGTEIGD